MKTKQYVMLAALLTVGTASLPAHGGDDHTKPAAAIASEETNSIRSVCQQSVASDSFPHLHPLIVHFPIVLLLLAPFIGIAGLIRPRSEISWIALIVMGAGFLGALIATEIVHPHTTGLGPAAIFVLERHELFAELTLWFAGTATLASGAALITRRFRWIEILGLVFALAAAGSVSVAGHYGAKLVHIHGIGPCGAGLEIY